MKITRIHRKRKSWFKVNPLFFVLVLIILLISFRLLSLPAGILAITLHGITDFNRQIPANALMFFFLLGLTYRIMAGKLGGNEKGGKGANGSNEQ